MTLEIILIYLSFKNFRIKKFEPKIFETRIYHIDFKIYLPLLSLVFVVSLKKNIRNQID
jgi:hypothetical protein